MLSAWHLYVNKCLACIWVYFSLCSVAKNEEALHCVLLCISSFHLGGENQISNVLYWSLMILAHKNVFMCVCYSFGKKKMSLYALWFNKLHLTLILLFYVSYSVGLHRYVDLFECIRFHSCSDMLISSICCSFSPLSVSSVYPFHTNRLLACRFSVLFPFLAVSACTTACCHSTLFQLQLLFTCQQAPSLTSTCAVCHIIQSSVPPPGFRPVALPRFAVVTLQGSCGTCGLQGSLSHPAVIHFLFVSVCVVYMVQESI